MQALASSTAHQTPVLMAVSPSTSRDVATMRTLSTLTMAGDRSGSGDHTVVCTYAREGMTGLSKGKLGNCQQTRLLAKVLFVHSPAQQWLVRQHGGQQADS